MKYDLHHLILLFQSDLSWSILYPIDLGIEVNELWFIWFGGGKGYFRHPSKLFYIKGISFGQTPTFCHFWICWWTSFPENFRLQRYAEVAENSLGLIKNVSITKTWFSKPDLWPIKKHQIGTKLSASLLDDLSHTKVAYLHDSLRVHFQENTFSVIWNK